VEFDAQALLTILWDNWNDVFKKNLDPAERSLVSELRDIRNRHADQKTFSGDDTYRALDSAERLLNAISALEAEQVRQMKDELMRLRFEESLRSEKRKEAAAVSGRPAEGLSAWRDLIQPHKNVSSGKYARAEFAADLWQVFQGEGVDEYCDPVEFFRLRRLGRILTGIRPWIIERFETSHHQVATFSTLPSPPVCHESRGAPGANHLGSRRIRIPPIPTTTQEAATVVCERVTGVHQSRSPD
jgi:hypothetical protein